MYELYESSFKLQKDVLLPNMQVPISIKLLSFYNSFWNLLFHNQKKTYNLKLKWLIYA